ncbi:fungal specific transcription factor domain-containing protein [Sarocladium implicatum]|nr:fungal specific transcription factor domain-containing protein [Sarocladium implicatum]
MGFEFIDSTLPVDPAARQRIRRQAALGKNLGRKLTRPSRIQHPSKPRHLSPARISDVSPDSRRRSRDPDDGSPGQVVEQLVLPKPDHQIGNSLSQLGFTKIGPDGLVMNAVSFVLQAPRAAEMGIGKAVDPGKVHMFSRLMFQDEAYFHGTIALSLRALSTRPEAGTLPSTLAMQHMARSLQLINTRLAAKDGLTDINIAVIVVMTQYARMSGQLDDCRIHLDGLNRMIQLKGGINAIRPDLAEKVFRTDLSSAYHLSAPTLFTLDEVEEFSRPVVGPGGFLSNSQRQVTSAMMEPDLLLALSSANHNIFLDATRLTQVLDDAYSGKRAWLTVRELHQATLYIGYQIVGAPPQSEPDVDRDIDLLVRLGTVTWCLSFFRNFDNKIIQSSPLGIAVDRVVQALYSRGAWAEELVLWTLFIGHVVQIFGPELRPSIMKRAKQCLRTLGLSSWAETARLLAKFPWSDALNGETGRMMWDLLALLPEPAGISSRVHYEVTLR